MAEDGSSSLQGTIRRITYQDPQTRYTVARLDEDGGPGATIVGMIFPVAEGEEIRVSGVWKRHARYGLQFQVQQWQKIDPATKEGIEKYLGSGMIKGIGPVYAKRLVETFGLDTLRVLSEEPLRILDVGGIGETRARRIIEAWQSQRGMQDVMVFLQGHGVGASLALRIYRVFGAATIEKVRENPYALAREVHGIGFLLADRLAEQIGICGDFPLRVQAGVLHTLREMAERGHCFAELASLKRNAAALLSVEEDPVEAAVFKLAAGGDLAVEETEDGITQVYLDEIYHAEQRVASDFGALLATPSTVQNEKFSGPWRSRGAARGAVDLLSPELFGPASVTLDEDQVRAAEQGLREKVLVITGGPGTGKTTLLTALLTILRRAEVTFALAAPTGRAAKRMAESSGEEAVTIHRLLEFNPREGGFQRTEGRPLEAEFVIVDEASMVDLLLMDHLLRAVNPHSHLILIGDVDQLPSVGPGSVLRDLIDSGVVPKVVLQRVFRQDRESLIVANAHRILAGQSIVWSEDWRRQRDFAFIPRESEEEILATVKELVREGIPSALQLAPGEVAQTVQVLTPMHRGLLGTIQLNRELQSLLNPDGQRLERGSFALRVGDKVMQLRNNYDKAVFNGDLGQVAAIDAEDGGIRVDFFDKLVAYEADELDDIGLAYAISVHKSQGSEYPAVVIPLHTSHYLLLHRSILYTAVTRGKKLVILVGSKRALAMAVRNFRVERRNTGLAAKLAGAARSRRLL